jgi:hypothetical protein
MKKIFLDFIRIFEKWYLQHIRVKKEGLLFWYETVRKNPRKKTAIFL